MNPFHHVHEWIANAPWDSPALAPAGRVIDRTRVATLEERVVPDRAQPLSRHRVSVVIPCYNYGHFLASAVGSALEQEHVDVEVIVVDDASTDDSAAKARELADASPGVRLVRNETNLGQGTTFNVGLENSTGEFIVRLDADDLLTPGSLSRAVTLMEARPNVGLVYGHPRHFSTAAPPAPRVGVVTWTSWSGEDWLTERCRRAVNCITTSEAMVRRDVFDSVGAWNNRRLRFAQDMEMWMRAASVADVGRVNGVDQALHREHDDSLSATAAAGFLPDLLERRLAFMEFFSARGADLVDGDHLRRLAMGALCREAAGHLRFLHDRGRDDDSTRRTVVQFIDETLPPGEPSPSLSPTGHRSTALGSAAAFGRALGARAKAEAEYATWVRTGL